MNHKECQNELREMKKLRDRIIRAQVHLPEGKLFTEMLHGKYPQYYFADEESTKKSPRGRYLRANEMNLATQYAQAEYNQKMLMQLNKLEKLMQRSLPATTMNLYEELANVYMKMSPAKRLLIEPYVLPDDMYVETWRKSFETEENTYPKENGIETEQGEIVRSKSEKLIADKLYMMHIPYVYEAKLTLKNRHVVFPDFTILNLRNRKVFYLEHFGMMDDKDYCRKALEKLDLYEENQILLGQNLFALFESSQKVIRTKSIELIISRMI